MLLGLSQWLLGVKGMQWGLKWMNNEGPLMRTWCKHCSINKSLKKGEITLSSFHAIYLWALSLSSSCKLPLCFLVSIGYGPTHRSFIGARSTCKVLVERSHLIWAPFKHWCGNHSCLSLLSCFWCQSLLIKSDLRCLELLKHLRLFLGWFGVHWRCWEWSCHFVPIWVY